MSWTSLRQGHRQVCGLGCKCEQDGNHMIQNGGNSPQPRMRSVLTINHPSRTPDRPISAQWVDVWALSNFKAIAIVTAYFVASSYFTSATFLPCCVHDTHTKIDAIISPNSCPSNHIPTTQLYGVTCTTRARQCGISCQPLLYCGQWGFFPGAVAVDPSTWDQHLPDVGCWWDKDQHCTDIPDLHC